MADEIAYTVKTAGSTFLTQVSAEPLAEALGRSLPETEKEEHEVCTTAALVLANGCLLHRRLRNEPDILPDLTALEDILLQKVPARDLASAWSVVLKKDYRPVFEPAHAVAAVIEEWDSPPTTRAVKSIIEVSKNQADKLSDLGYDYAGPLYHKILASAKSDGAFYTKNTSALLLAGLALPEPNNPIWTDPQRARNLKIVDPACGTGTLLIAALQTIKSRLNDVSGSDGRDAHRHYVEEGIYGFDINPQAVQMAASNLTFGATSVDFRKMNLYTLPHGVNDKGEAKAGALEFLGYANPDLFFRAEKQILGHQIESGDNVALPESGFDLVIMNPPFSNNQARSTKFSPSDKRAMQLHELAIAEKVRARNGDLVRGAISSNSIGSFFPVIADNLLSTNKNATIAELLPIAGCTGAGSAAKRRYLAKHFHIERLVVCHVNCADGHSSAKVGFSSNEAQFECLMIARRRNPNDVSPDTDVVVLHRLPQNTDEVTNLLGTIFQAGQVDPYWGKRHRIKREKIIDGDWSAVQWYDASMIEAVNKIGTLSNLQEIGGGGGAGWSAQGTVRQRHVECLPLGPAPRRIVDAFIVEH